MFAALLAFFDGKLLKFVVLVSCLCLTLAAAVYGYTLLPKRTAWASPRNDASWFSLHQKNLEIAKRGGIDLVYLGEPLPIAERDEDWDRFFRKYANKYHSADFSIAGEQTQNLLWRLQHGETDGYSPKLAILSIGASNLDTDCDGDIVEGVVACLREMRRRLPGARILVTHVTPIQQLPDDTLLQRRLEGVNTELERYVCLEGGVYLGSEPLVGDKLDNVVRSKQVELSNGTYFGTWIDACNHVNSLWNSKVMFPSDVEAKSPDGKYCIVNLDFLPDIDDGQPHHLFLKENGVSGRGKLVVLPESRGFERCVEVMWSPDSKRFAVNNWWGSNVCYTCMYRVEAPEAPKYIDYPDSSEFYGKDVFTHCITFIPKWINNTCAHFVVTGDYLNKGLPEGENSVACTECYLFDVVSSTFKLIRRSDVPCKDND